MTHTEAITAQNGILALISVSMQDGGIDTAGRALYRCRKAIAEGAEWSAAELDWLASLDHDYHVDIGSMKPWK